MPNKKKEKNVYKKALDLHKNTVGKIEIKSKIKLNKKNLALAYTPGVAEVSRKISKDPSLAKTYTLKKNTVAIVSDGSAVLGLGNLGPLPSIPVMEGKAAIFKEFAGVDAFPITLKTQEAEEIIKIVKNISPSFGGINLEDISAPRCFEIEKRLRDELDVPVMHDDQWGTATVVLTALINSLKLRHVKYNKNDIKIVINGVGAAGYAIGKLLDSYGFKSISYVDSKGGIYNGRKDLVKEKKELLRKSSVKNALGNLEEIIKNKDIFIGVSKPKILTRKMVKSMNNKPIIFALSNPTPEIMPSDALKAGAFIVATGRSDFPNQINNSLVFPGLFRAMLKHDIPQFKIEMFSAVAKSLAKSTKKPNTKKILPSMWDREAIKIISKVIKKFK